MRRESGISSFSVILVTVALSLVGLFSATRLKLQYTPAVKEKTVNVTFSMPGASAMVVENEVTSRIEAVLSTIRSRSRIVSQSSDGSGRVSVTFDKYADIASVRMEVASAIRNLYPQLPDGVSYPTVSLTSEGVKRKLAVSFCVRSDRSPREISSYIDDHMLIPLSSVPGVNDVMQYGGTSYSWNIVYDSDLLRSLGMSPSEIAAAVRDCIGDVSAGLVTVDGERFPVQVTKGGCGSLEDIPVCRKGDRIIFLRDVAKVRYEELPPTSYYRINGQNTVTVNCYVDPDTNLLSVCSDLRKTVSELAALSPQWMSVTVEQDSSEYLRDELGRIYFRTGLCILILLLFVLVVYRSWRMLGFVFLTIMANLLVAMGLYALLDIRMHIYTLAGITVSIGIIIDSSIMMTDHYARHRDRSVFPSLVCAVLTTVAAVSVVFLLPDEEKASLTDFCAVIAVNLSVSLLVAYFFIPAAFRGSAVLTREKKTPRWENAYRKYISWAAGHRWVLALVLVLSFGIPTCLIPDKPKEDQKFWKAVTEWEPYAQNRRTVDSWLGSSFALFYRALDRGNFYREPVRTSLMIHAGMPEGCTVNQLDEIVSRMENYLSQFDEIQTYTTSISSYDDASIQVFFKPEYEDGPFPTALKSDVITTAMNFGGATWRVTGVNDSYFNNNVVTNYKSNGISLTGYNYEALTLYASILMEKMSQYRRISEPELWGEGYRAAPKDEFVMSYDSYAMALAGVTPGQYFRALQSHLYDQGIGSVMYGGELTPIYLVSSDREKYDLWNMNNAALTVDSTEVKLPGIGKVRKIKAGIPIRRVNQSYEVNVRYDFIGSWQLSSECTRELVDYMNDEVLPVGFNAAAQGGWWNDDARKQYGGLILLVLAIIWVLCSIAFESLHKSLCVLLMIPLSFVGTFLVFGLSDLTFDKGGFAAFVMLGGLVVNAAIYLIYAFDRIRKSAPDASAADIYLLAFREKLRPIALTVISTILGLLPFLSDGPTEVFWFDFAAGTIGGLLFSFIALIFLLPPFLIGARTVKKHKRS